MRIIAGNLGGRLIKAPKGTGTRPMTDKVRAALFDSIGSIAGYKVLDAYAGSGAIGFEALSRGAAQVVAVEAGRQALQAIQANQKELGVGWGYSLYQMTVEAWLARQAEDQHFDLIIADPPYEQLRSDVLEKLRALLAPDGRMVVSHSAKRRLPPLEGLRKVSDRIYGDSALALYRATGA